MSRNSNKIALRKKYRGGRKSRKMTKRNKRMTVHKRKNRKHKRKTRRHRGGLCAPWNKKCNERKKKLNECKKVYDVNTIEECDIKRAQQDNSPDPFGAAYLEAGDALSPPAAKEKEEKEKQKKQGETHKFNSYQMTRGPDPAPLTREDTGTQEDARLGIPSKDNKDNKDINLI